ncbi:UNVERIFIED_CONTAM: hypothetical protein K2H54_023347 [Gekko kuhli]
MKGISVAEIIDGPLMAKINTTSVSPRKVAKGVTVGNLSVAPPSFHLKSSCSVLPLTKMDAQKGILSLIERGLIPRAARITLEEPLVLPKSAPLHEFHTKHKKRMADGSAESKKAETRLGPPRSRTSKGSKGTKGSIAPPPSCTSVLSLRKPKLVPAIQMRESAINRICRLKTSEVTATQPFQNLAVEFEVVVRKGNLDQEAADLVAFKQYCCLFWGSALSFLECVARLLKDYAVPSAVIKGKKVMELLLDFEFRQRPTREELLSVIKNHAAVRKLLNRPGQRYKGRNGTQAAATKIQATWRCYRCRKAYINFHRRQWASGVVAISWLVRMHMCRVRKTLRESRQKHLENFCVRAKVGCAAGVSFPNNPLLESSP